MTTITSNLPMPAVADKEARPAGGDPVEPGNSGRFASILGSEAEASSGGNGVFSDSDSLPGGGKVLQSGGKDLPEASASEPDALLAAITVPAAAELSPKDLAMVDHSNPQLAAVRLHGLMTVDGVSLTTAGSQTEIPIEAEAAGSAQALDSPLSLATAASIAVSGTSLGVNTIASRSPGGDSTPGQLLPADPGDILLESVQLSGNATSTSPLPAPSDSLPKPPFAGNAQEDLPLELVGAVKVADVEPADKKVPEQVQMKQPSIDQAALIAVSHRDLDLSGGLKIAPSANMTTPVGHPGWGGELAGRINLMVSGGSSEANLQLSPPELGRLEVRISTEDDQTKILFTVQHAHAREAIEQAMPRLREMLEQSGLQLAHSSVADQSMSQQGGSGAAHGGAEPVPVEIESGSAALDPARLARASDAAVDYYV